MKDFKNDSTATLSRFGKDKRTRTVKTEYVERRPRINRESDEHTKNHTEHTRRSFNPNFNENNRLVRDNGDFDGSRNYEKPFGERPRRNDNSDFGRRDGKSEYGRPHTFYGGKRETESRQFEGHRKSSYPPKNDNRFGKRYGDNHEASFEERRGNASEGSFSGNSYTRKPQSSGNGFTQSRRTGETKSRFDGKRNTDGNKRTSSYDKRNGASRERYNSKDFGNKRYGTRAKAAEGDKPKSYPKYNPNKQTGEVRLNRFIAQSGLCSRREADDFITAGLVTVNGTVVTELGTKVMPTDEVKFNDSVVRGEKKVYLVLNKPKGYVTTLEDPHATKIVTDLVKDACTERIYPVGRLDKNSLGLLLFTNDGDLTKQLTHPSYKKKKIYQIRLDKPLTRADMDKIAEGITLEDGDIYADEISYVKDDKKEIGIEIHSGRNRIIRRIFEHLGYSVEKLDRVYYAGLTKKNLKRGAWRFLTNDEVIRLKSGQYE